MKNYAKLFKMSMALLMLEGLLGVSDLSAQNKLNTLKFDKTSQLRDFFSYKGDGTILVSGHRGGYEVGYAENCIEGLENVLTQMPAFFEIMKLSEERTALSSSIIRIIVIFEFCPVN